MEDEHHGEPVPVAEPLWFGVGGIRRPLKPWKATEREGSVTETGEN